MKPSPLSLWKSMSARQRKLVAWTAGSLLFYTVFGFLILPFIVRAITVKQISTLVDREVSIRHVRINPYVLSGTIRGLLVKDKDGEPFLSFDEAYANFQLSSFLRKPWVFKEAWVINPYCRVQINPDYSFNFSDIARKLSAPSPPPKKPTRPVELAIGKFQIIGASAALTDRTLSPPFRRVIGPVQIILTGLHTAPNNENPYSFMGTTDSGEKFSWTGRFALEPLQSAGELTLEGLSIPKYAPLFQDLVRFKIKDGMVDGRAVYQFKMLGSNFMANVTKASCTLRSLRMSEPADAENVLEMDRFSMIGASGDTQARSGEIAQVIVDGARLGVKRAHDQTINLIQLSQPAEGKTNTPGGVLYLLQAATNAFAALVQSTNLLSATLHQLEVTNCSLQWDDEAMPSPVHLKLDDVTLSARHLSNVAGTNETAEFSVRWNTNGIARLGTAVQLSPPSADVAVHVTNLDLSPLGPYLALFMNLSVTGGKLGVEGTLQVQFETNNLPRAAFRGDARLDDFGAIDAQTKELLKWNSVQVSGLEADLQPPSVAIKQISVLEPTAHIALDTNQNLNFLAVLKISETNITTSPVSATTAPTAPKPDTKQLSLSQKLGGILRQAFASTNASAGGSILPKVTVDTIAISNGSVRFNDRSVQPPVSTSFEELNGTIAGVSSEELKQAELHLTAKASRTGPIELSGRINPINRNGPAQITLAFRDIDLSPASPYSGKFLGYRLNRGRLGLQADYEVTERHIKAKNVVVLDQLTLGEKVPSPDATKLPVKLAIALLKDRNGKIEVELPIDGNLDDPDFHLGKVIARVLGNVITKIVTSPFAALGALFGGKGEEISYQDFAPGSAQLQMEHVRELDALINGLYERPGLELQIEGSFDPVADGAALRKQKLEQKFRQEKWASLRKSEQDRISADQIPLTAEDYASQLEAAYAEALRSGSASNALQTVGAPSDRAIQPAEGLGSSSQQKGATALFQKPVSRPKLAFNEKEQVILSTIQIPEDDLVHLAIERAQNTRQRILESGKVDAARLFLVDLTANPSTNRASRVYFHLE